MVALYIVAFIVAVVAFNLVAFIVLTSVAKNKSGTVVLTKAWHQSRARRLGGDTSSSENSGLLSVIVGLILIVAAGPFLVAGRIKGAELGCILLLVCLVAAWLFGWI